MSRVTDLLRCELPIQLAPMGSASASPALALAVAGAGGHAVYHRARDLHAHRAANSSLCHCGNCSGGSRRAPVASRRSDDHNGTLREDPAGAAPEPVGDDEAVMAPPATNEPRSGARQ